MRTVYARCMHKCAIRGQECIHLKDKDGPYTGPTGIERYWKHCPYDHRSEVKPVTTEIDDDEPTSAIPLMGAYTFVCKGCPAGCELVSSNRILPTHCLVDGGREEWEEIC